MWTSMTASQAPSSSQRSLPQIFLDEDGSPLSVFVESNGVSENRPRLIKTLRNHGARICFDVSQAHVILVEPNSPQGRQFVRDWSGDPDKVVLEVAWIRRCTDAGRALLAKDAWGGCGDLDGTPLPGDGEDEDIDSNQPPKKPVSRNSTVPRAPRSATSSETPQTPLPVPPPSLTTVPDRNRLQSYENSYAMQHLSAPIATSSAHPPHGRSPLSYDMHAQSTQHQAIQPYHPLATQYMRAMPNQSQALTVARTPHFSAEAMAAYVADNPDFMNILFNEIAQRNNVSQAQSSFSHSWPRNMGFSPRIPNNFEVNMSQGSSSNVPFMEHGASAGTRHVASKNPEYEQPTRSQMRRSIGHEENTLSPRNGHNIDSTLSASQLPATQTSAGESHNLPSLSSTNTRKRLHEVYDQSATPSRSHSSDKNNRNGTKKQKLPPVADKQAGIFTSDSGKPYNFFVQVQVRNRIELVKQIKKNGGQICFEPSEADFIILVPQPDKMSEQWMKSVIDLQRYALRPAFVETCLEEGRLVDEEEFLLSQGTTSKKKGKGRAASSIKIEAADNEKSPTPPPPEGTQKRGRAVYTPEEKDYARRYALRAFRQRPNMTLNDLGEELSQRVSTHNSAGWTAHLHSFGVEFERIRAEARRMDRSHSKSVESEDADSVGPLEPAKEEVEEAGPLPPDKDKSTPDLTPVVPESEKLAKLDASLKKLLEEDFSTIINYFADPPDGVEGDDQLWADLANKHTCLTAPSWQDFYKDHNEDVNNRLIKALNMKEAFV